jgi:hypothetical protein
MRSRSAVNEPWSEPPTFSTKGPVLCQRLGDLYDLVKEI